MAFVIVPFSAPFSHLPPFWQLHISRFERRRNGQKSILVQRTRKCGRFEIRNKGKRLGLVRERPISAASVESKFVTPFTWLHLLTMPCIYTVNLDPMFKPEFRADDADQHEDTSS